MMLPRQTQIREGLGWKEKGKFPSVMSPHTVLLDTPRPPGLGMQSHLEALRVALRPRTLESNRLKLKIWIGHMVAICGSRCVFQILHFQEF